MGWQWYTTTDCTSNTRSTYIVAYESKPANGKRYALYADGRIEHLTDNEIEATGTDPDPLTSMERAASSEEKEKRENDDFVRRSQEKLAQDEKEREEKAKRDRE